MELVLTLFLCAIALYILRIFTKSPLPLPPNYIKPQSKFIDNPNNILTRQAHFETLGKSIEPLLTTISPSQRLSLPTNHGNNPLECLKNYAKGPPIQRPDHSKATYTLINSPDLLLQVVNTITNCHTTIAIDIENCNRRTYQGYICLIQISTHNSNYIIDALKLRAEIKKHLGPKVFHCPKITKIFHGAHSDVLWLQRDFDIFVVNYFDTQIFGKLLYDKQGKSLHVLWQDFCDFQMSKEQKQKFQQSDWSCRPLTDQQLNYAMLDSLFLIYLRDSMIRQFLRESPQSEDNGLLLDVFREMETVSLKKYVNDAFSVKISVQNYNRLACKHHGDREERVVQRFIALSRLRDDLAREWDEDLNFVCLGEDMFNLAVEGCQNPKEVESVFRGNLRSVPPMMQGKNVKKVLNILRDEGSQTYLEEIREMKSQGGGSGVGRTEQEKKQKRKEERREILKKKFATKSPVYENCRMYAPDRTLLCHCDRDRINWYVSKGIAEQISDDPPAIKLLFEPNGTKSRDHSDYDNEFYSADRVNRCVICGNTENYMRYHIIPSIYRQHFPPAFKSHRSHDVVLVCFSCHELANCEMDKFKKQIAREYDVPLVMNSQGLNVKKHFETIKRTSHNLRTNDQTLPENRKIDLRNFLIESLNELLPLSEYLQAKVEGIETKHFKQELLQRLTKLDLKEFKKSYQKPVKARNDHGFYIVEKVEDLEAFVKRWRRHFVDIHQPKYLPQNWHVEHKVQRSFGEKSAFAQKS